VDLINISRVRIRRMDFVAAYSGKCCCVQQQRESVMKTVGGIILAMRKVAANELCFINERVELCFHPAPQA
jgi:hypothetical protein